MGKGVGKKKRDIVKERKRERERDEEGMRIRKERKRAKRDRNSDISLGRKWERKGAVKVQVPCFISILRSLKKRCANILCLK